MPEQLNVEALILCRTIEMVPDCCGIGMLHVRMPQDASVWCDICHNTDADEACDGLPFRLGSMHLDGRLFRCPLELGRAPTMA